MSMSYVRKFYGIQVFRGMKVLCKAWDGWTTGTVTSCTHYVHIRPDNWPNMRLRFHPQDRQNWRSA